MDLEKVSNWMKKSSSKKLDEQHEYSNHLGEMQTWLRNLEQHVLSLNARLGAIEQRLSISHQVHTDKEHTLKFQNENNLDPTFQVSYELANKHVHHLNQKITDLSKTLDQLQQRFEQVAINQKNTANKINNLDTQKQIRPILMKLGNKEIPLELSGLIGGCICFLVAALSMNGATYIVLSPWFLTGIGLLLITGTFLRTNISISLLKKVVNIILPHWVKSRIYHSDSTP